MRARHYVSDCDGDRFRCAKLSGRVKILDFGLAKVHAKSAASADGRTVTIEEQTDPGTVLGTVGYMSPEQVRGENADSRSDIFALGTILYEMVTGKTAFRKSTKADTISAILTEDPPSISQITPATPPALQRVVHRCLEKNMEQRFHSAHDLAFALGRTVRFEQCSTGHSRARNGKEMVVAGHGDRCFSPGCNRCGHLLVTQPKRNNTLRKLHGDTEHLLGKCDGRCHFSGWQIDRKR